MKRLIRDLWHFALQRKRWWLIPLLFLTVLVGLLGVLLGHPAVAPFLYTVF
jgi:hypothetical protein